MKYKVSTDQFRFLEENEVINKEDSVDHDGQWVHFSDLIETFPMWFQPVEEEVKEGDWVIADCSATKGYLIRLTNPANHRGQAVSTEWFTPDGRYHVTKGCFNEIRRKATTPEITQALTEEAKRRGLIGNKYESLQNNNVVCVGDVIGYNEDMDKLWVGESECLGYRGVAYCKGEWAELIEPTIEINGKKIEVKDGTVTIDCRDTIEEDMFKNFYAVVNKYDLKVSRNGEQINEQLQQIWDKMPTRTACRPFKGTITDVTFLNSNIWRNE